MMVPPGCRYVGQINTTDFFTRLLCGILYSGIAPQTFYTAPHGEEHFDGMPIDFVSGVIAATASAERAGFGTYHVVNPHWQDGVSLDRIVDWVQSAGYKVGQEPLLRLFWLRGAHHGCMRACMQTVPSYSMGRLSNAGQFI